MKGIKKIPHLTNTTVLVRAALNAPVENGKVTNTFRLRQSLPTIEFLQKQGAKVVLIGHLGDKGTESLRPVFDALQTMLPRLEFCPVPLGKETREAVSALKSGDILMLENLRWMKGEKDNSPAFAHELASLGDIFVQDSFDVCHRPHASVVGIPKYLPSYAGFLVEEEVKQLTKALKPKHPALAIIGGAKFFTKEPVLHALLKNYNHVFVGGALANDLLKAEGLNVADSFVSNSPLGPMRALAHNSRILLPTDARVAAPEAMQSESKIVEVQQVPEHTAMLDVGPATIEMLAPYIKKAKTILWNGPLGRYEHGYTSGTHDLARIVQSSNAYSVLGGGDTVAALDGLGLTKKFSFVSTGGGAMLDFLVSGTLPGLKALG